MPRLAGEDPPTGVEAGRPRLVLFQCTYLYSRAGGREFLVRPHGLPRVQLCIPVCRPDGPPSRQGGRAVLAAPRVARGHARGLEGLAARGEECGLEGREGGLALDHVPVVGIEAGQVYLVASLVVDVDVRTYHVSQDTWHAARCGGVTNPSTGHRDAVGRSKAQ